MRQTFFLNHIRSLSLLGLLLTVISYLYIDIPLAKYFEHINPLLHCSAQTITDLIDPKFHYFLWPLLFFTMRFYTKKKTLAHRFLLITISIPLTNLLVSLIKLIFGRARPELLLEQQIFGFTFFSIRDIYLSFPSGHACTAGALFRAFSCFFPRYTSLFFVLGLLCAFTRVILDYHFLSDVIAGYFIGLFVSQYLYVQMKNKQISIG